MANMQLDISVLDLLSTHPKEFMDRCLPALMYYFFSSIGLTRTSSCGTCSSSKVEIKFLDSKMLASSNGVFPLRLALAMLLI